MEYMYCKTGLVNSEDLNKLNYLIQNLIQNHFCLLHSNLHLRPFQFLLRILNSFIFYDHLFRLFKKLKSESALSKLIFLKGS